MLVMVKRIYAVKFESLTWTSLFIASASIPKKLNCTFCSV